MICKGCGVWDVICVWDEGCVGYVCIMLESVLHDAVTRVSGHCNSHNAVTLEFNDFLNNDTIGGRTVVIMITEVDTSMSIVEVQLHVLLKV